MIPIKAELLSDYRQARNKKTKKKKSKKKHFIKLKINIPKYWLDLLRQQKCFS